MGAVPSENSPPLKRAPALLGPLWALGNPRFWRQLGGAFHGVQNSGGLGFAKGAAYSALLAIFPVVTTTAAILLELNAEEVWRTLSMWLFTVVPPGSDDVLRRNLSLTRAKSMGLLVAASVFSAFAASGVIESLVDGMQAAYNFRNRRSFWKRSLISFGLVFVCVVPAVVASALILFGGRLSQSLAVWSGLLAPGDPFRGGLAFFTEFVTYLVALTTTTLVTALLYRLAPDIPKNLRCPVLPGAILATTLWLAVTLLFAGYVRNLSRYDVVYGSIGTLVALVVWMYLLAIAALVGCEFNVRANSPDRKAS